MYPYILLLPLLALTTTCLGTSSTPSRWQQGERVPDSTMIQASILLAHPDTAPATDALLDMSDPMSANYGKHWTAQDVVRAFSPQHQFVDPVKKWLLATIQLEDLRLSNSGDQLHFTTSARDLGRLLNTTYYHFSDGQSPQIACRSYSVPNEIASLVDYITPTLLLPHAHHGLPKRHNSPPLVSIARSDKRAALPAALSDCRLFTTPSCLRSFYHLPTLDWDATSPHPNSTLGIFELSYVTWRPEDLDSFFSYFSPSHIGSRPTVTAINGGYLQYLYNISAFNLEADLDFSYAISLLPTNQSVTNLQVGDAYTQGNLNHLLAAFDKFYCPSLSQSIDKTSSFPNPKPNGYNATIDCGTVPKPPSVISISYSWSEVDFPPEYLKRQCTEFLKLGLQGTSVVVSSGDTGVQSGIAPGTCIDPITGHHENPRGNFSPQWPASCPWVTVVGGTQLSTQTGDVNVPPPGIPPNMTVEFEETVFRAAAGSEDTLRAVLSSSGGFSNTHLAPSYQKAAVGRYLENIAHSISNMTKKFNTTGRGYPDVSLLASTYLAVVSDKLTTTFGTSASAPVFASMLTLLNNQRLREGKKPLGFVNPALYASAALPPPKGKGKAKGKGKGKPTASGPFNDIVKGANAGCGLDEAFQATEGWDAATGLGSVDFERLRQVLADLP